jgi:replicative superfamily II helicase
MDVCYVDLEAIKKEKRLQKLRTYFDHFNIEQRYKLTFEQFTRKVENETWEAYLAENMILPQHVRESCYSQ